MQLFDDGLRTFARTGPNEGSAFVMHFQHVPGRFVRRKTHDALEDHGDVGHQIHGIIVHHDIPGRVDHILVARFDPGNDSGATHTASNCMAGRNATRSRALCIRPVVCAAGKVTRAASAPRIHSASRSAPATCRKGR